ncbi:MAG TPA: hypothetical protein VJS64_00470 [Pyrinomonadaceae bacterium]|nr:hypothetical protein [Pyrinomonadaceae bacterium]
MKTVTRPDGTKFILSSRVTYFAIGWVLPARRAAVVALLNGFLIELRAGSSPEQSAQALEEPIRSEGIRAASLIRQFEGIIGAPSVPIVEESVRTPQHPDNIGIFCGRPHQCEAAADSGDQVARALAELLLALGAIDAICANID